MILHDISEAKQYLPSLNLTPANDHFTDFFSRAQRWLVSRVIGETVESKIDNNQPIAADDPRLPLATLCRRVIAEKALLDAIPEMDMQLTEAGFAVQDNDNFSPASAQRVERLLATLPGRIAMDVDALVEYLFDHTQENEYRLVWYGSDQFKKLTSCFVPYWKEMESGLKKYRQQTEGFDYERYYNMLRPGANETKALTAYYISEAEFDRLLSLYRNGTLTDVQKTAVSHLKEAVLAELACAFGQARNEVIECRNVMLSDPDSFTEFKASKAFPKRSINLDGGKTVNFL